MKVLNLLCARDHRFEGWFASEDDFQSQTERGLLVCPMCGEAGVSRLPSAPRLNVFRQRDSATAVDVAPPDKSALDLHQATAQSQVIQAMRQLMAKTEDVGERFPEEARRIHYGEAAERGIRGRATPEEAASLADEGIAVMAVPLSDVFKGETH